MITDGSAKFKVKSTLNDAYDYTNRAVDGRYILLGGNEDLDTITKFGRYRCSTVDVARTIKNCPIADPFYMLVFGGAYGVQVLYGVWGNNINTVYMRTQSSATVWDKWEQIGGDSWKVINRYSLARNFYPDETNRDMSRRGYWGTYITNKDVITQVAPKGNGLSSYCYIFTAPLSNYNGDIFQFALEWMSSSLWIRRGNGTTSKIKDVPFERIAKISDIQALQDKIAALEQRVKTLESK